jgi:signal transduction histidine kinase
VSVSARSLKWLYERLGSRVVLVCVLGGTAIQGATGILTIVGAARYLRLSLSECGELLAIALPINVVSGLATLWWSRSLFRTGISWSNGLRTPEHAVEVWDAGVRGPYVVCQRLILCTSAGLIPVVASIIVLFHQPAFVAVPLVVGGAGGIFAAAILIAFSSELVLRPMLSDVAGELPAVFEPTFRVWRLRTKALAPLPVVTFFAAIGVAAFVDLHASRPVRFTIAIALAIAMVGLAALVFHVLTRSTLDPLDELTAATHRIRAGDLSTRVRVVTADDLGELTSSFNQMMDGLQERDALRERNAELVSDLRASRARIVAASDAERRRVERNIHDGAQQQLVALAMKLRALEERVAGDDSLRAAIAAAGERTKQAMAELRELARGLHPSILTTDGLCPALEQLASRSDQTVTISAPRERFPEAVESAAYFVACEALANTGKYAQASHATVSIQQQNGRLIVEVADDGVGGARTDAGTGLTGLQDRIAALDGLLTIDSPKGCGTKVIAELPLK